MTVAAWSSTADVWAGRAAQSQVPGFESEIDYLATHLNDPSAADTANDLAARITAARSRRVRDLFEMITMLKVVNSLPSSAAVAANVMASRALTHNEHAALTSKSDIVSALQALILRPALGTYMPNSSPYTGPAAGTVFTQLVGDRTITDSNQIFVNIHFTGTITIKGSNNYFFNCRFVRLTPADSTTGVILGDSTDQGNLRGAVFENCLITGEYVTTTAGGFSEHVDGIRGGNFTVRRCEFRGVVDGIGLVSQKGNVTIEGNWFHDCKYGPSTTQGSGDTHNDCIQIHMGGNYVIRYNYFGGVRGPVGNPGAGDDFWTSGILMAQSLISGYALIDGVLITKNWFEGSGSCINMAGKAENNLAGVTVSQNVFFPVTPNNYKILRNGALCQATITGNVMWDNTSNKYGTSPGIAVGAVAAPIQG